MSAPVRIAIVSPHRDDAAFSCGILTAALLCAGAAVTVANLFTISDYALQPERFTGNVPDERIQAISAERRREDEIFAREANKHGPGTLHLHDLEWQDAPLRLGIAPEQVLLSPLSSAEVHRQAKELSQELNFLDTFHAVLAPLGLGDHIDHRVAREAAKLAVSPAKLALYEDLPYAARMPTQQRDNIAGTIANASSSESHLRYTVRMPQAAHLKTQFAMTYRSQIAPEVAREVGAFAAALGDGERWYSGTSCARQLHDAVQRVATITRDDGQ